MEASTSRVGENQEEGLQELALRIRRALGPIQGEEGLRIRRGSNQERVGEEGKSWEEVGRSTEGTGMVIHPFCFRFSGEFERVGKEEKRRKANMG